MPNLSFFICGHKKSMAFPESIFMKQHWVQASYTEFHMNHIIKVKRNNRNPFTLLSKERIALRRLLQNSQSLRCFSTKFYQNCKNVQKIWAQFHECLKYACHCTYLHKTHNAHHCVEVFYIKLYPNCLTNVKEKRDITSVIL